MTRIAQINAIAALVLMIAPFQAGAAEGEKTIALEPLYTTEITLEDSFFAPKGAEDIQSIAVIDADLEESLFWDKQGS